MDVGAGRGFLTWRRFPRPRKFRSIRRKKDGDVEMPGPLAFADLKLFGFSPGGATLNKPYRLS